MLENEFMLLFIKIIHVVTCVVFLIPAVLIQSGKGAEISASFGGSSQTIFGTTGGANFLVKLTYGAASVFMVTSLMLTVMGSRDRKSIFDAPGSAPVSTGGTPSATGTTSAPANAPQTKPAPSSSPAPAGAGSTR